MSEPLRIAYIGNFRPDHSTETHVARTLVQMGHKVLRLQQDGTPVSEHRRRILYAVDRPDLVLYTRTPPGLDDPSAVGLWHECEYLGITTAAYHLDVFHGLARSDDVTVDSMFKMAYVFTADGDHDDQFAAAGVNHHWVRPAVVEDECNPGRYQTRLACDVAFVGSHPYPHPEWPYRGEMIDRVKAWCQRTGRTFRHWGPGGEPTLRGRPLNDLYATAKIVVGDSLCPAGPASRYWSDRVYETVGRGGFLIHPRIDALVEELGESGEHLVWYPFGDFDRLEGLLDEWIDNASARRDVAARGRRYVSEHCTYRQRMTEVLAVTGLVQPVAP